MNLYDLVLSVYPYETKQVILSLYVFAGTGYYLQLVDTDKRPGYSAAVYTEYLVMNASCMELFYHFTGNANTTIEVLIITEDLQV